MELTQWAELSNVVTAAVAVLALVGAVWEVHVSRESQREATASALYADYLSLAMQNPKLASACVKVPPANEWSEEFECYEWFVSLMLHACERIIDLTKGDEAWEAAIKAQLTYHRDYLSTERFERGFYSQELCDLVAQSHSAAT